MKNKILIVGARRCGTTFVGKVLSKAQNTNYFFEPFNKDQGIKYLPTVWYPYLTEGNIKTQELEVLDALFFNQKTKYKVSLYNGDFVWWDLNRYDLLRNVFINYSDESLLMRLTRVLFKNRSNYEYYKFKVSKNVKNLIFKDPLASLSTSFLTDRYEFKTVVMLRHPYSYYYSMKKQDWGANPYENFFSQQGLNKMFGERYGEILDTYKNNKKLYSLIEYMIVYNELSQFKDNESYYFLKHEELSLNPNHEFKKVYEFCGLNFNSKIQKYIFDNTKANNKKDTKKVSNTKRDSKSIIYNWKGKISKEEMNLIKELTFDIIKDYYPDEEW